MRGEEDGKKLPDTEPWGYTARILLSGCKFLSGTAEVASYSTAGWDLIPIWCSG